MTPECIILVSYLFSQVASSCKFIQRYAYYRFIFFTWYLKLHLLFIYLYRRYTFLEIEGKGTQAKCMHMHRSYEGSYAYICIHKGTRYIHYLFLHFFTLCVSSSLSTSSHRPPDHHHRQIILSHLSLISSKSLSFSSRLDYSYFISSQAFLLFSSSSSSFLILSASSAKIDSGTML